MTITSTTRIAGPFVGAGTTATFSFTFKIFEPEDLYVTELNTATGITTYLVLSSHYTALLHADQNASPGGSITLLGGPLATGYTLTISSQVPALQEVELLNAGGFYPDVINDALDKLTILVQQVQVNAVGIGPPGPTGGKGDKGDKGDPGNTGPTGPPTTFLGPWNSATAYLVGQGVSYQGQSYVALIANTNVTPVVGATWGLLAQAGTSITFTGPWNSATAYIAGQGVSYLGQSYMALVPNTNVTPVVGATWGLLAQAGTNGVSSLAQLAAVRTACPATANLYNPALLTVGSAVNANTGVVAALANVNATGFIPCNSGSVMSSSGVSYGVNPNGLAYYDQNQVYISGSTTPIAAGGTFSPPATAAFVRISYQGTGLVNLMIVNGPTLPAIFVGWQSAAITDVNVGVLQATAIPGAFAGAIMPNRNLFNAATVSIGAINRNTGVLDTSQTGLSSSDYISVAGMGSIATLNTIGVSGNYGPAFYDVNKVYLNGVSTSTPAGGTIAIPANAEYIRFYTGNAGVAVVSVVPGTVPPTAVLTYTVPSNYDLGVAVTTTLGIQNAISVVKTPSNLFNLATVTPGAIKNNGQVDPAQTTWIYSDWILVAGLTNLVCSIGLPNSGGYGQCFYDINKTFISVTGFTIGVPVAVPANATYFRLYTLPSNIATLMLAAGTVLPPYLAYNPISEGATSSIYGQKVAFWGDSITATYNQWRTIVYQRTGLTLGFQDARNARPTQNVFEGYSGNSASGTNLGSGGPFPGSNTGTLGNTLAQDLAGVNVLVMWMGTNDGGNPIGSSTDAPGTASEYGYVKSVIAGILGQQPTIRLLWVTPYDSGRFSPRSVLEGVTACIQNACAQYGIPCLDLFHNSGLNSLNWNNLLLGDITHPTSAENATILGPMIAEFIKRNM